MTRFPRWRYSLLFLLSGILVVTSVQAEPVKLSVLLPMRGLYKDLGTDAKEGLLLGLQEEARVQNVDWKSWITLEFLDHRWEKSRGLPLAKDAVANGSKAILVCGSSAVGRAVHDYVLRVST